jgi:hypothetical protein
MAKVVDLSAERGRRRLRDYEVRLRTVLDQNRGALSHLFTSGSIFTRRGTRTGRELLLAHQHLLRVMDLLGRLEELSGEVGGRPSQQAELLYRELDELLEKTTQITARTTPRAGIHHD